MNRQHAYRLSGCISRWRFAGLLASERQRCDIGRCCDRSVVATAVFAPSALLPRTARLLYGFRSCLWYKLTRRNLFLQLRPF
jgi:hypothetical protein